MKKSPLFYFAFAVIAGLLFSAVFAGWIGPYSPQDEERAHSYHPPTRIHVRDTDGSFHRPFVYRTRSYFDENLKKSFVDDPSVKYFLKWGERKLFSVDPPARIYLLGADLRGRDVFSRILHGARISLSLAVLGAFLSTVIGLFIGSISGYFGGRFDQILMRVSEFFIMIPGLYFLLALRSVLPPSLGSREVYMMIVLVLSAISWGGVARVIRGMVFSIRESDFISAAKVLGRSDLEILRRHVLPHTLAYLMVVISASVPGYIFGESALSVLGLGIQEPEVTWGNLLQEALSIAHIQLHPWVLFPGFVICLAVFCFHILADSFQQSVVEQP